MPVRAVRLICKGSGDFKLHDAQFIARHSDGSTRMGYAIVNDAHEIKGRVKLNY